MNYGSLSMALYCKPPELAPLYKPKKCVGRRRGGYEVRREHKTGSGLIALTGSHQCFIEHGLVTNRRKETVTFVMVIDKCAIVCTGE
jgi:hypothetical protein